MAGALRSASVRLPLVVILGATGTGKSKLAMEIARIFNGEIISADSMQVYKGLDIITNKVTRQEQLECPHHMLDFVSPLRSTYTVVEFRNKALTIIDDLMSKRILPIIVGGTNYYIEALLWKLLIDTQVSDSDSPVVTSGDEKGELSVPELTQDGNTGNIAKNTGSSEKLSGLENCADTADNHFESPKGCSSKIKERKFAEIPSEELHKKLMVIDPDMAQQLHPKNRRKIIRALEVHEQHGVPMSLLLAEQHQLEGASHVSGPLRYPNPCILWIRGDQTVLDERTDSRVDSMLESGLIQELTDFHKEYNEQRLTDKRAADYTLGIFQSIGFKEFHSYLLLSPEDRETPMGKLLFQEGVEELKRVTRRYSRKQKKWIINRFLKRRGANVPPVYGLDATDPSQWKSLVLEPAVSVVQACIEGKEPPVPPLPCEENTNPPTHQVCHHCGGLVFVTVKDWQAHLKGRRHKKALTKHRAASHGSTHGPGNAGDPHPREKQARFDNHKETHLNEQQSFSDQSKPGGPSDAWTS